MSEHVSLKHRLMKQAQEAQEKQMAAEKAAEAALKDEFAWVDDVDPKLWELQEKLLASSSLTEKLNSLAIKPLESLEASTPQLKLDGQGKSYKWKTSLDSLFTFNFRTATPHQDLQHIMWDDSVLGIQRSESGSEGVFFVDTTKGAVVVKGSRSIGSEVFASLLATKLGIVAPRFRIVPTLSREGLTFCRRIKSIDPSGACLIRLEPQMHLLLKSYVVGTSLSQTTAARAEAIFGSGSLSEEGKLRLREIGRLLVLDILCNFGDRFPLIWDNRGNPGNLMFDAVSGQVIAIDSQVCPIDRVQYEQVFQEYLIKVSKVIDQAIDCFKHQTESPFFARVRAKIEEYSKFDVGVEGTIEIQRGFLDVVQSYDQINLTFDEMQEWKQILNQFSPTLVGLEAVNLNFISSVWQMFKDRKYEI